MTEHLDAGWYEWVTSNLGRDPARASAATRAAAQAVSQGRGFNAAADAARASWEADRIAQAAVISKTDPSTVPRSLVTATVLAVGGALASIALILWMVPPTVACNDYCPAIRNIGYLFLAGNVAVAGLHASLFLLMWRRRAPAAWWASITLVGAILGFDLLGELTTVVASLNPNSQLILGGVGAITAVVPAAMVLLGRLGADGAEVAHHWLLFHLLLVELPIGLLLSTRPARHWCRVYLMIGGGLHQV